jgi:phosphoglycolate phosphatase
MATYLFDIDMTLLDPAGAGRAGMELAYQDLFGTPIEQAFVGVPFAGRTDRFILREALRHGGLVDDAGHLRREVDGTRTFDDLLPRFVALYAGYLVHTLPAKPGRVLPGVPDLLAALAAMPGSRLGLATGNFRRAAMLKLGHYGLAEHLREGAFGDDHIERAALVADAVQCLDGADPLPGGPRHDVFVIGDTQHDVAAAKANGCVAVAVATGYTSFADLQAAGADIIFTDFSDPPAVVDALHGWQAAATGNGSGDR